MEAALILKLLDLAFLGFTAYQDFQMQQGQNQENADRIQALRIKLLKGEISEEEAMAQIDEVIGGIIGRRRAAFAQLPKPTGHS
jgi:hypothetical protein